MRFFRLVLFLLLLAPAAPAAAYSVLTHQSIIDSTWEKCLLPLLEKRYPGATVEQQDMAKSYAYGGAIIQDMGYYPLGNSLFTNLTHYVRSGDFVRNLLRDARTRDEYAFALGALAHYASDNVGHPEAINVILPEVYPERREKYGPVVTYEQAPVNHSEVEFSFDVMQIATGRYRSQDYHKYIGFRVDKPLLEKAFRQTYGLELGQVTFNVDLGVGAFRLAVNHILPAAARAAWHSKRDAIVEASPTARRRDYVYHTNRRKFRHEYGKDYEWPGFGARLLAGLINLLPKKGALRTYSFRIPSADEAAIFHKTYRNALSRYCTLMGQQSADTTVAATPLPNLNLDLGQPTRPTDYVLADITYSDLLRKLRQRKYQDLSPALRQNILAFYATAPAPSAPPVRYTKATKDEQKNSHKNRRRRREAEEALTELRAMK